MLTVDIEEAFGGPLIATLAWDDAPGGTITAHTEPRLINDLDMVLIGPDGLARSPWILAPLPIDLDTIWGTQSPITQADVTPARRCTQSYFWEGERSATCEDHLNNIEQIRVDQPAPGVWTLLLRGVRVPEGPQAYSLVLGQQCTLTP